MSAAPVTGWNRRQEVPERGCHPGVLAGHHAPIAWSWETLSKANNYMLELSPLIGEDRSSTLFSAQLIPSILPKSSSLHTRRESSPTPDALSADPATVSTLLHQIATLQARIEALERAQVTAPSTQSAVEIDASDTIHTVGRWLEENRESYLGQWVALKDGTLQGVGLSLAALKQDLATRGRSLGGSFVTKVL